jgi:Dynein heavy chain, N-terminal region 1
VVTVNAPVISHMMQFNSCMLMGCVLLLQVPEAALNVTLQEDKYHRHIQDLSLMLRTYAAAAATLTPVETILLKKQLLGLQVGWTYTHVLHT